jgi:hypothetical protein
MSGAPSDERSGLSFVLVTVRPLSVNMGAETRIVEPEGTAVARERPINTFPRLRTRDATIETVGNSAFYWVRPEAV